MTVLPTSNGTKVAAQPFRFLLCRRLRLSLPLSSRSGRRGRRIDLFDNHVQRALRLGCWARGVRPRLRCCVNVQGGRGSGGRRTCSSVTWNLGSSTSWTVADWSHCNAPIPTDTQNQRTHIGHTHTHTHTHHPKNIQRTHGNSNDGTHDTRRTHTEL